jgi:type IV secretory pathway VirB10-like protein
MRSIFTAIITFALLALFAGCGEQAEPADAADTTAVVADSATIDAHEVRPDSAARPERPVAPDGERPVAPDGERPVAPDGERPVAPDGERPVAPETPEAPPTTT